MKATTKQALVVSAWLAVLLGVIGGTILWQHQIRKPRHAVTAITVTSTERIPTVMLLDHQLNTEQQRQIVATMQRNNGSQSVTTVRVATDGSVKLSGDFRQSDNRPYLKIELPKNITATKQAELIQTAITVTKKQYHYAHYNLVAYGTGGLVATNFLENTTRKSTPAHFIAIASPFNGTDKSKNNQSNRPVAATDRTAVLQRLVTKRAIIDPKIKVLLVAGNAKGHRNGDGVVPVQSALAGQSIFQPIVKNYRAITIRSWQAGHTSILGSWKLGNAIQEFIN